ncbi:MAG: lycopene cyclase family protein [Siphonobacter sp.]
MFRFTSTPSLSDLKYDIIIAGGGMAGLSLAYYLNHSSLCDKKILIIDREEKKKNDRTWGFWEQHDSAFESILHRKWAYAWFHGTNEYSEKLELAPYSYKLLRGIDFYTFVQNDLAQNPNIKFLYASIDSIQSVNDGISVQTTEGSFWAYWCFDSTQPILSSAKENNQTLLQHFKGWVIQTNQPVFDADTPVMMDFRISQQEECRFVYVLPSSPTRALVEFTLFSPTLLNPEDYDEALRNYLNQFLKISNYQIIEEESGSIPMTDVRVSEQPQPHHIRVGSSGGYTRASTGYTFARTQKRLQKIVQNLEKSFATSPLEGAPVLARFHFYDRVFLNVFLHKRHSAADLFSKLYRRNSAACIFRFLDEQSSLREDLSVIWSMPTYPFTRAAFDLLKKNIMGKFKQ